MVESGSGQKANTYRKIANANRTGDMAQVVEHLPSKQKALSSKPSTATTKCMILHNTFFVMVKYIYFTKLCGRLYYIVMKLVHEHCPQKRDCGAASSWVPTVSPLGTSDICMKSPSKASWGLASLPPQHFKKGLVEHFFMCLLATHAASFENYLFSSFAHLFSGLLILCGIFFF
jgi:hypothetical protein